MSVILTESTLDLPREILSAHPCISVMPMDFTFGDERVYDIAGETDNHLYYDRIRAGETAHTSQFNMEYLKNAFRKHLDAGEDILYLGFDSALSGTCSNAFCVANELREEYPDRKIACVDCMLPCMAQGTVVLETAKRLEATGEDVNALAAFAEEFRTKCHAWFTVEDLIYLKRGGRISAAAAAMGNMLNIKPILRVDAEGRLIPTIKERGRKRALKTLVDNMMKLSPDTNYPIMIGHADSLEDAQTVAAMVKEKTGVEPFAVDYIGLTIGSHAGPGTIALFFVGSVRE